MRRTFGSRAAANTWLATVNPATVPGGKMTLGSWLTEWLKQPSRSTLQPATVSYYAGMAAVWQGTPLAKRSLASITPVMIEDQLDEWLRERRYSRTTVEHLRTILGTAMASAVRAGRLTGSPVPAVTIKGHAEPNRVKTIRISDQVVKDIGDAVIGHPLRAAFELMLYTGMRPGEICALTWDDILPINGHEVNVQRAMKCRRRTGKPTEWFVGEPKTAGSNRRVSFDPMLAPILHQYYGRNGKPYPNGDAWVFPGTHDDGLPLRPTELSRAFRRAVDAAGVSVRRGEKRSELRLYDMRGINASRLLAAGVDPVTVANRLGHADIVSTMRRYAGVVGEKDRAAAGQARVWDSLRAPKAKKATKATTGEQQVSARKT
jgi:integrase